MTMIKKQSVCIAAVGLLIAGCASVKGESENTGSAVAPVASAVAQPVAAVAQPVAAVPPSAVAAVAAPVPAAVSNEITSADFKRAIQTAVKNMVRSKMLDNPTGGRYVVTVSHVADMTKKKFDTADIKQKLAETLAASRKVRVVAAGNRKNAPQIIVAGRITQRTAYVRGGRKRQEYYLHVVLTDANSGMALGENVTPVVKKQK